MDHLSSLPPELLSNILSYLIRPLSSFPALTGTPKTIPLYQYYTSLPLDKKTRTNHPYYNLAATSRGLRLAVEGYCEYLYRLYPKVVLTKHIPVETASEWDGLVLMKPHHVGKGRGPRRSRLSWRDAWVKSTFKGCMFCERATEARATFDLMIFCNAECDNREWGPRITKTSVTRAHHIKPVIYRDPAAVFSDPHLRPLKVGMRPDGGVSTYYLLSEVKALKEYIMKHDPSGQIVRAAAREDKQRENTESKGYFTEDRLSTDARAWKASWEEIQACGYKDDSWYCVNPWQWKIRRNAPPAPNFTAQSGKTADDAIEL